MIGANLTTENPNIDKDKQARCFSNYCNARKVFERNGCVFEVEEELLGNLSDELFHDEAKYDQLLNLLVSRNTRTNRQEFR